MDIQDSTAAIYSEAKSEYTKQLVYNFQPVLLRFFIDRYTETKTSLTVTSKAKSSLGEFQESLSQIPEWNLDKVQRETVTLMQNVHCDYVEDLITAVFIAHTKVLSAIRLNAKPRQKIRITVPKPDHFMHRCLSECSRLLWSNVYLFTDSATSLERQKNMTDVNRILEEGIIQAIRNLLPVKSILRDSLQEDDDDAVQLTNDSHDIPTPLAETPVAQPMAEPVAEPLAQPLVEPVAEPLAQPLAEPVSQGEILNIKPVAEQNVQLDIGSQGGMQDDVKTVTATKPHSVVSVEKQGSTLVVDTEKSVGFTGYDSVFGTTGDAELRPMVDEASDDFKIIGDLESLDVDEIEDIQSVDQSVTPLGADDYETL